MLVLRRKRVDANIIGGPTWPLEGFLPQQRYGAPIGFAM